MQKRNFVAKFQKFQRFKFQKGQVTVSKAILEGQYKYQTLQDSFPNLPEGSIWNLEFPDLEFGISGFGISNPEHPTRNFKPPTRIP